MKQTVSILVENHAGVLSRVSGLFSRRGFNIDSLAVGVTDDSSVSRITIVVDGDDYMLEQVEKQLNKLIDVIKLRTLPQDEIISRELMLIKVTAKSDARGDVMDIAKIMGAKISDITTSTMTVEIADTAERLQTMLDLLTPYGIKEVVRTGTIALQRAENRLRFKNRSDAYFKEEYKMAKIFYESDCNLSLLDGKTVAVIGYGSQGHAHALNLHESGVDVVVGLYEGSKSWKKAEDAGLKVMTTEEAAKAADFIMILVPDERQADLYKKEHRPIFDRR